MILNPELSVFLHGPFHFLTHHTINIKFAYLSFLCIEEDSAIQYINSNTLLTGSELR